MTGQKSGNHDNDEMKNGSQDDEMKNGGRDDEDKKIFGKMTR